MGVIQVHAPFSLQDLSQIEKPLGSYSVNPGNYIKEFQYLAQAYDLSWHDLHVVQTSTLTAKEGERIQAAAREHADQVCLTDATMPVGARLFLQQTQGRPLTPRPHDPIRMAKMAADAKVAKVAADAKTT